MLKKLIDKFSALYEKHSIVSLGKNGHISNKAIIKGARIYGEVEIAEAAKITKGVRLNGSIKIGRYTSINGPNTDLQAMIGRIEVGCFSSIARNVTIQEFNHRFDSLTTYYIHQNIFGENISQDIISKGDIIIGNDVWIGTHCVILSGAKIGDGAVVAANSVVTGEVPPYAIVAGSPAKIIRFRFDSGIIEELLELQWWNWPVEKIKANRHLFRDKLSKELLDTVRG